LTQPDALLVFDCDAFTVAVRQKRLYAVRALKRKGCQGWVDATGLHVRHGTLRLNFKPLPLSPRERRSESARSVVVPLPAAPSPTLPANPLTKRAKAA
jgi:hypothetical protein